MLEVICQQAWCQLLLSVSGASINRARQGAVTLTGLIASEKLFLPEFVSFRFFFIFPISKHNESLTSKMKDKPCIFTHLQGNEESIAWIMVAVRMIVSKKNTFQRRRKQSKNYLDFLLQVVF